MTVIDKSKFAPADLRGQHFDNEAMLDGLPRALDALARYGAAFMLVVGGNATIEDFRRHVDTNDRTKWRLERAFFQRIAQDGSLQEIPGVKLTPLTAGIEAKHGAMYALSEENATRLALLNIDGQGDFKPVTVAPMPQTSRVLTARGNTDIGRMIKRLP